MLPLLINISGQLGFSENQLLPKGGKGLVWEDCATSNLLFLQYYKIIKGSTTIKNIGTWWLIFQYQVERKGSYDQRGSFQRIFTVGHYSPNWQCSKVQVHMVELPLSSCKVAQPGNKDGRGQQREPGQRAWPSHLEAKPHLRLIRSEAIKEAVRRLQSQLEPSRSPCHSSEKHSIRNPHRREWAISQ